MINDEQKRTLLENSTITHLVSYLVNDRNIMTTRIKTQLDQFIYNDIHRIYVYIKIRYDTYMKMSHFISIIFN